MSSNNERQDTDLTDLLIPQRLPRKGVWRGWIWIGVYSVLVLSWLLFRLMQPVGWKQLMSPVVGELMSLLETSSLFTLPVLWLALWWRQRQPRAMAVITSVGELQALSPAQFEHFVAQMFRGKGYRVTVRGKSGDKGVDLELTKVGGKRAIVQCKRYRSKISPEIARELYGTLIHEKAAHAFLVTTAEISAATRAWASGKSMTLIDGASLVQAAASLGDKMERRPATAASAKRARKSRLFKLVPPSSATLQSRPSVPNWISSGG